MSGNFIFVPVNCTWFGQQPEQTLHNARQASCKRQANRVIFSKGKVIIVAKDTGYIHMTPVTMIFLFIGFVIFLVMIKNMYSKGTYLKTETVQADEIQGVFTLTLYGANDPKQAVFLDIEDDEYTFVINDSSHNFTVTNGISAEQSLQEAVNFIDSQNHRISRIHHQGKTIGYEIRPIYQTLQFGHPDILDIQYRLEDQKVHISVDVKRSVRSTYDREKFGGE